MAGVESLKRGQERLSAKVLCGTVPAKAPAYEGFQHQGITARGGNSHGTELTSPRRQRRQAACSMAGCPNPQEECRIPEVSHRAVDTGFALI